MYQTIWPQSDVDAANTGSHPDADGPRAPIEREWQFPFEETGATQPIVADDTVYVGTTGNALHALDVDTGDTRWQFQSPQSVRGTPAVSGDTLVTGNDAIPVIRYMEQRIGGRGGRTPGLHTLALDSGAVLADAAPDVDLYSDVAYADGSIYVCMRHELRDGSVRRYDAETLEEIWSVDVGAFPRVTPAVSSTYVIVGDDANRVRALDRQSGDEVWSVDTELLTAAGNQRHDGVHSAPVVADGVVLVVDFRGNLLALDLETGDHLWELTEDVYRKPVVANGTAYCPTRQCGRRIREVDVQTGEVEFVVSTSAPHASHGLCLVGSRLYVPCRDSPAEDADGRISIVDVGREAVVDAVELDDTPQAAPTVLDESIFVTLATSIVKHS